VFFFHEEKSKYFSKVWAWQNEINTDGHGQIDSAIDPDQECIYFI